MATDRPDDADADTGWIFEPQSEDEAGLSYRGRSVRAESSPSSRSPATPTNAAQAGAAQSRTPGTPGTPGAADASVPPAMPVPPTTPPAQSGPTTSATSGRVGSPQTAAAPPSESPNYDDVGPATAAFTPSWAGGPPSVASARPAAAAAPSTPTRPGRTPARPPHSPATGRPGGAAGQAPANGSKPPSPPGARPPSGGGAGQAIAVGALVGTIVLLVAWFFLLRDPGTDATRATPVRSSAASVSASATPTPTRSTPKATRTTAPPSPKAARTSASPSASPTPSPTSTLNDASNRLGWTYIIDGLGPVTLGLSAEKATALGVLQDVASGCSDHSPTDLLGDTKVYSTGGEVTAIDIRSAAFASGRGIRVGTGLDNLKTIYGEALKSTTMTDGGSQIKQWALTSNSQFVAYIIGSNGAVSRIVIGYRGSDGSITLPPPC